MNRAKLWLSVSWLTRMGVGLAVLFLFAIVALGDGSLTLHAVKVEQIAPDIEADIGMKALKVSAQELEALIRRKLELREQAAAKRDTLLPSPPGLPLLLSQSTRIGNLDATEFHGTPGELVIGRNNRNTQANSALGSTLAEPAAANNALHVFAAGNASHAEFSNDGGVTWQDVPLPAGPGDAPILCCDHDVIIDDARRVTFHSTLYLGEDSEGNLHGVVRIFVRRDPPVAACSYTIDPDGLANNILPDYPHLGLTKRYLYLTMNAVGNDGGGFARIQRFNLDQMSDCLTITDFATFDQSFDTFGHRVWVPAEGTNNIETMYWGQLDNTTTFRIFQWREAKAAPTSVTRTISASTFINPDCRGGQNDLDWLERDTAFSISGFRLRCAAAPGANKSGVGVLACYWNVGPDDVHLQGHVHAAVFNLSGFKLKAQPHIFNNDFCFGYPIVTANKRGDIGITIALGGKNGGGGDAVHAGVGIDDEFTPGLGFFQTIFTTATGTHNPSDERYGDYSTIHPYEPCEKWFSATNYALLDGADVTNVNSRYVEFGRRQSFRCYAAHRNQQPAAE